MNNGREPAKTKPVVAETGFLKGLHNGMGIAAKSMVASFVIFTVLNVDYAGKIYSSVRGWIDHALSWYYITTIIVIFFLCIGLMFSRFGSIRLGPDDSRPEFSNFSWFAMLFSAGVRIGIMFFGVAEPLFYFDNTAGWGYPNNPFADMAGHSAMNIERAIDAVRVTNFHWGFHGWAIYTVTGLALAYFSFRKKLPLTFRSALYPVLGERIYGPAGHAVDLLAVFSTVFGLATSMGLGATQMGQGLNVLFGIDPGVVTQSILIIVISIIATMSSVSGVAKGVRILSEWNITLTLILIAFFLLAGPTQWLVGFTLSSIGSYFSNMLGMGFWTANEPGDVSWQGSWTIFYWGWWLSWAPFVGMFVARISRGRTIREFMMGAMLVPTAMSFLWICIFGGNSLFIELHAPSGVGTAGLVEMVNNWNLGGALYGTIQQLTDIPMLAWGIAALATFLLATWFITSADSGVLVVVTILSMGNVHPPRNHRIVWGMTVGIVSVVLLTAGGLSALQTAAIASAMPVSVLVVLMGWGVVKSLLEDSGEAPDPEAAESPDGTSNTRELHA